jgi:hypothetical protein
MIVYTTMRGRNAWTVVARSTAIVTKPEIGKSDELSQRWRPKQLVKVSLILGMRSRVKKNLDWSKDQNILLIPAPPLGCDRHFLGSNPKNLSSQ